MVHVEAGCRWRREFRSFWDHGEVMGRADGSPKVHRLDHEDAGRVVPCLVRAFWEYPETCHLLPVVHVRRRVLPRYLASDVRDAARFGGLEVASIDGDVVGASAWLGPHAYPVSRHRQIVEGASLATVAPWAIGALRESLRGAAANRERHVQFPPHYWLRAIGVDPDRQGQGIGATLLRAMLDQADAEGRGCFLFTATEQNARWYESIGFSTVSAYHPTPTWPQVWAMWREAT